MELSEVEDNPYHAKDAIGYYKKAINSWQKISKETYVYEISK